MVGSFIRHVSIPFALLMVAAFAPAQQEKPAVVIKTETRVVQVDAVVTDRSGTLVEDLTAKDFHVWEDNKEQTITSFSVENHSGRAPRHLTRCYSSTIPIWICRRNRAPVRRRSGLWRPMRGRKT